MKIRFLLLFASCSLFSIDCMGAELNEEKLSAEKSSSPVLCSINEREKDQLYLSHEKGAQNGDKDSCYVLANYYYLGRQFFENPEKVKTSYYKDGNERIYYGIGKVQVEEEDYKKAAELYEKAALQNHLESLWSLGECYELKRGVEENFLQARIYYSKAAKANYPPAQRSLGLLYLEGLGGVAKDYYEAVKWFRKAAEQNFASAQSNLGMMYFLGRGVTKSESEALKWFRKAADQGFANAQIKLGEMYRKGYGIKRNDSEAIKWYQKAVDQGYAPAKTNLEEMVENRKMIAQANLGEIIENSKKTAKSVPSGSMMRLEESLYRQSLLSDYKTVTQPKARPEKIAKNPPKGKVFPHQGLIDTQLGLGQLHLNTKNYSGAIKCFRQAADQGDERACNTVGLMYEDGQGVPKSNSEAVKWYQKAADQGYAKAQTNLARMYRNGLGVVQSDHEAVKWYRKAADQGFVGAQSNLGWMYKNGLGVPQSDSEAIIWYQKAADQGYAPAQLNLAEIYKKGRGGVVQSDSEASKWYQKAMDQGYENASGYPGVYYSVGIAQKDPREIRKAADQGDPLAQFDLGMMYNYGLQGVEKNHSEAVKWYQKAADQGESLAQFCIGMMYKNGQGIEKNNSEAIKFFHKAAKQGDRNALSIVNNLSKRNLNEDKTSPVAKKVEKWQPSEGNLVEAGNFIMILKREIGKSPNPSEMVNYLQNKMNIPSSQAESILDELGLIEL